MTLETYPNPDLTVGADNKQRWNQPQHRRHGFHNAHTLFRRVHMVRSREVLALEPAGPEEQISHPAVDALCAHPAFSSISCVRGGKILLERSAPDFGPDRPHSIQSISKLHIHLIMGRLIAEGRIDPGKQVRDYLPDVGSGYARARVQDVLDMNVANDFTEDYADPNSDCYTEEAALGWRLPSRGQPEPALREFICAISGGDPTNATGQAIYKSANTDLLTLIAAAVSPRPLLAEVEAIADAAGYEGAFHISLSPDGYPAFSGGGCLGARDLARFGQIFARRGRDIQGRPLADHAFLETSLTRHAPMISPPRNWLRYSNHLMTDGRLLGHAGYGGQFLMVDMKTGLSCAFFSVLENDAGYDDAYASKMVCALRDLCLATG